MGQAGDGGCPDIAVVRIRLPQVVRDDQLGSGLPGIIRPCVYHPVNIQVDIRAQAIGIVILVLPNLVPAGFLGAGEAVGGGNGLGVVRLVAVVGCICPLGDSPPPLGEDRSDCGRIVSLVHHVGFGQICRAAGYIHQHLLHGVAHNGACGVVLGQVPEVVVLVLYTIRGEGNDLNGGGGAALIVLNPYLLAMGAAHLNRVVCIVDCVIAARHGRVELQLQGQRKVGIVQGFFESVQQLSVVSGPPLFRDSHIHIAQAAVVDVIDRLGADLLGRAVGDLIAVVGGADGVALVVGVAGAGVEEGLRIASPCR